MTRKAAPPPPTDFTPVPVRARHDGWTPDRQVTFIESLAATGSVAAAAKTVGMGLTSAYELRARADAAEFRAAWQLALDHAMQNLADAALDRALNGVTNPIFFRGEQVGERRTYDEKLTMFLLRLRAPDQFGRWRDGRMPLDQPDGIARRLHAALERVGRAAIAAIRNIRLPLPDMPDAALLLPRDDAEDLASARLDRQLQDALDEDQRARLAALKAEDEGGM